MGRNTHLRLSCRLNCRHGDRSNLVELFLVHQVLHTGGGHGGHSSLVELFLVHQVLHIGGGHGDHSSLIELFPIAPEKVDCVRVSHGAGIEGAAGVHA